MKTPNLFMVKETSYSGNLLCFMFCIKATAHQGGNEKKWLKDIALIFEEDRSWPLLRKPLQK
jgi:hypothetical protein